MRLHLHLHHFQGPPQHTAQDIRIPQFVLCAPIVRQLDKVSKGVLVKDERKLVIVRSPVCDLRGDVEEYFEPDLGTLVSTRTSRGAAGRTYPCNHVGCLSEIGTPLHGVRLGEVVFYQAQTYVVSHLVQLLVHLGVVVVKVLAQLGYHRAVGEGY